MARVTTVKAARKAQGKCGSCGKPINVGDPYRHATPRAGKFEKGRKLVRCMDPKCSFKPSDLSSSKMAEVMAACEAAETDIDNWSPDDGLEELKGILEQVVEQANATADEYQESADNIENGFGTSTQMSEALGELADELHSWADEVENALSAVDDEPPSCTEHNEADDECEDCQREKDAWGDEAREAAMSAISEALPEFSL